MSPSLSRRGILVALARILPWVVCSGSLAQVLHAAEPGQTPGPALAQLPSVLREMFPHRGLPADFYAEVAGKLWQQVGGEPGKSAELGSGLARLAACCGDGGWERAGHDARVAALTNLQDEAFFQALRESALMLIYRDPRVWAHIGYGGNALAQGGYVTRGFDQIDWLPAANP